MAKTKSILQANRTGWDDHPKSAAISENLRGALDAKHIQVVSRERIIDAVLYVIHRAYLPILYVRWVSDDHIESTILDDSIEFDKPMERLVGLEPAGMFFLAVSAREVDAVVLGEMLIERIIEISEATVKFDFVLAGHGSIALGLALAEGVEKLLQVCGLNFDFIDLLLANQVTLSGRANFGKCSIADERVAGADVEVDVGQWLDAEVGLGGVGFDLGCEFEE